MVNPLVGWLLESTEHGLEISSGVTIVMTAAVFYVTLKCFLVGRLNPISTVKRYLETANRRWFMNLEEAKAYDAVMNYRTICAALSNMTIARMGTLSVDNAKTRRRYDQAMRGVDETREQVAMYFSNLSDEDIEYIASHLALKSNTDAEAYADFLKKERADATARGFRPHAHIYRRRNLMRRAS